MIGVGLSVDHGKDKSLREDGRRNSRKSPDRFRLESLQYAYTLTIRQRYRCRCCKVDISNLKAEAPNIQDLIKVHLPHRVIVSR